MQQRPNDPRRADRSRYRPESSGDRYTRDDARYDGDRYARSDARYGGDRYARDDARYDGDRYARSDARYGGDRYAREDGRGSARSRYGATDGARRAQPGQDRARAQRTGYGAPRQTRVPASRAEYEAMQRQQLLRKIAPIAALAALALVLIIAVVLILKPHPARDVSATTASLPAEAVEEAAEAGADEVPEATPLPTPGPTVEPASAHGLRSVRLRVVGDIMMCAGNLKYAKRHNYDFTDQFSMVKNLLSDADYTMGNMEGTVGQYNTSKYSGYPQFNCPETVLDAVKGAGVDFLTLANNHMLDRWTGGLQNTVTWVEKYGLDHVGGYRTQEEKNAPVVYDVGGIKFGFLAYTHSTNTMERTTDEEGVALVPYIQKADFTADVKKLRDAGAEVVVAWPHWGKEYVRDPDDSQKKYAKRLANAGVDIILGSHSHMVQPMGYQTVTDVNGRTHDVFCIFSLGNFISDHVKQYCDNGVILDLTVNEHEDGSFTVDNVGYIPTYTWKQGGGIRVMPSGPYLQQRPQGMDDENYNRMVEGYNEIVEALGTNFRILNNIT